MPRIRPWIFAIGFVFPTTTVVAEGVGDITVQGIEGEALDNVRKTVSLLHLDEAERESLSPARLAYLFDKAEKEIDRALQPYGYYHATVRPEKTRKKKRDHWVLMVEPGPETRVTALNISIKDEAASDPVINALVGAFRPQKGDVLNHAEYESSKSAIQRGLLARGYFDAEMTQHRVEVSREANQAAIFLNWNGGARYHFGETRFEGSPVRESLLYKTIPYLQGEHYEQDELLRLHQRLTALDYFGYIDVRPDVENAKNQEVPILISLSPGKRTVYTGGVSMGTDSGVGFQLGMERRWINDRGHKLATHLDWAQRRRSMGAEYRIPAFAWAEGWYVIGANRRDEESDVLKTRITEIAASRSGAYRGWTLSAALHARLEDYRLGHAASRREGTAIHGNSRLIYPALSAQRVVSDDPMYPRRGFSLRGEVKMGATALGSDVSFGQFLLESALIRSLGENNRILLRGKAGRTFSSQFDALPPSLRFFAGGDRSIRGYGYQEVGPRRDGLPIGGRNLLVGSVEYERMFSAQWGAAVFVDGGNAFNEINDGASVGAGVGLRWRSPVGMVRLDVAHGFDSDSRFQLHINIGPDL